MTISLVDLSSRPVLPDTDALTIRTTCTNRDLPARLPFGNEAGDFEMETSSAVKRIVALKKPTSTLRPPTGRSVLWRLISHLSLNYLSLVEEGKEALQEILKLYNFTRQRLFREADRGHRFHSQFQIVFPRPLRIRDYVRARYTRRDGTRRRAVCGCRSLSVREHRGAISGFIRFAEQLQPTGPSIQAAKGGNPGMAAPSGTPAPAVVTAVRYWDVTQHLSRRALDVPVLSGGPPAGANPA